MKKLLTILCGALTLAAAAQIQINPQLGMTLQNLTEAPDGTVVRSAVGGQLGVDFRVGNRLKFQPGFFLGRNATVVTVENDSVEIEDNLIRTMLKLKALVTYNIVYKEGFKLRVNLGPTYDILMSVDNKDDEIQWNKSDFNAGSFNIDGGLGLDIWFLTIETGASLGLTPAFKDDADLGKIDSKYFTWYLNLGVVFGDGMDD